jgi:hypothetical protein
MLIPLHLGELTLNLWGVFTLISFWFIMHWVKKTKGVGKHYSSSISAWVNNIFLSLGLLLDFNLVQKYPNPSIISFAVITVFCTICVVAIYSIKDNHLKYKGFFGKFYKGIPLIGLGLYIVLEAISLIIVPWKS